MNPRPGDTRMEITSRLHAAQSEFDAQTRRFEDLRARLQATFDQVRKGRPQREKLRESAFARLQARLDTMPVIEQAKGILMAQYRCSPEEAFDILRRASQSANVKVSVLAARIVEQVASPEPQPRGALRRLRQETGQVRTPLTGARPDMLPGSRASSRVHLGEAPS